MNFIILNWLTAITTCECVWLIYFLHNYHNWMFKIPLIGNCEEHWTYRKVKNCCCRSIKNCTVKHIRTSILQRSRQNKVTGKVHLKLIRLCVNQKNTNVFLLNAIVRSVDQRRKIRTFAYSFFVVHYFRLLIMNIQQNTNK